MNELYIAIAKVNYRRLFKSPWLWFTGVAIVLMVLVTALIRFADTEPSENGDMYYLFMWIISIVMFAATFWQYAWAMGNVDARGFHTDSNRVDRYFISFMSTLPLARGTHFLIQLSLYVITISALCLFSYLLHYLVTPADESIRLIVYGHFVLFIGLLYEGSNQVFIDMPPVFKGEIRSLKHPAVIRVMLRFVVIMVLLRMLGKLFEGYPEEFPVDISLSYIIANPWLLLLMLVICGLQFWRGYVIFKRVDIV